MLDQQYSDVRGQCADGGEKFLAFRFGHARCGFVEQKKLRPAGKRERDFQKTLLAIRQRRGALVHDIAEAKALHGLGDLFRDFALAADEPPPVAAQAKTFGHREADSLERR